MSLTHRQRRVFLFLSILWLIGAVALYFLNPAIVLLYFALSVLTGICLASPILPLLIMAATYPFINWQFVYAHINVPIVDLVAIIALAAWVVRLLWDVLTRPTAVKKRHWWGLGLFIVWIAIAVISSTQSYDMLLRLKYVLRPLAFFYLAFVFVPLHSVRTQQQLHKLVWVMYLVGVSIAVYGLYGFATLPTAHSFLDRRVTPVSIAGWFPLGANHNLIAGVMVTTLPIAFALLLKTKKSLAQKCIFLSIILMLAANLLTFSRTGWLALGAELIILILVHYRHHLKRVLKFTGWSIALMSPVILYMLLFSTQPNVDLSNKNRLLLNDIAQQAFQESPWFGTGPGTFMDFVSRNQVFMQEFGAPLDAHGFVQKVGSELGILGLFVWLLLLLSVVYRIVRGCRAASTRFGSTLMTSLLVMVVGSLLFQLFQTSYFLATLWFPIGIALATSSVMQRESRHPSPQRMEEDAPV